MEGFGFDFSQESLPQEDLDAMFNADGREQFFCEKSQGMAVQVQSAARSSLPAISDWPGDYGFSVTFGQTGVANAKNIHWIYRRAERKLYIGKNVPCPVHFSVSVPTPGAVVRAMAVYTSPQHASESVHRCLDHSMKEVLANVPEAEHLIRSQCPGAEYHQGPQRHSVTVPFENPPACSSTCIYKFACLSSCVGGPNRRPLTLVFTLEHNNVVMGRRSVHLRVCANPGRDSGAVRTPTKRIKAQQQVTVPKRKVKGKETLTISTSDPECYKFLLRERETHRLKRYMKDSSLLELEAHCLKMMESSSDDNFCSVEQ